jgi:hypothetical protein
MVHDFYRLGLVLRSGDSFYETGRVEKKPRNRFNLTNFIEPSKGSKRRKQQPSQLP